MSKLTQARRIVVITEKALEKGFLEQFLKLGVKGYNVMYCSGKGEHGLVDDPFTGPEHACVRIEMLTTDSIATAIMDYVHKDAVSHYPITAFADTVDVDSRDTFYK